MFLHPPAPHNCHPPDCDGTHIYDPRIAAALEKSVFKGHKREPFTCKCGKKWKPSKSGGWERVDGKPVRD